MKIMDLKIKEKERRKFREKKWNKIFPKIGSALDLKRNLSKTKKHLDFGCGDAIFTKILAERHPNIKVCGIDLDKDKIKIAKNRFVLKNLYLKCSKKISGKYDSITVTFTLHEIKNIKKILRELYKHLNKNGKILIYDFRKRDKQKFRQLVKNKSFFSSAEERSFKEMYLWHNRWTIKEFKQLMEGLGFKTLKIKPSREFWLAYVGTK